MGILAPQLGGWQLVCITSLTKTANKSPADSLRTITRAEIRMASEGDKIPKAQGRRTDLNLP
jgi:hypothetical protein